MANPMQALNDHFYYNCHLVKALLELLPNNAEKKMIHVWIDKLLEMDKSLEEMAIRSDYMWFILVMVQSKKIRGPFCQLPPANIIPLRQFVPLHFYEDVLIASEPNMIYSENIEEVLQERQKLSDGQSKDRPFACDLFFERF